MSIYKPKNSRFWQYDFVWKGKRFYGSTGEASKRRAETVVDKIKLDIKTSTGKPQMTLDNVVQSYWEYAGKHATDSKGDDERLCRLLGYIGPDLLMSQIAEPEISKAIEARRKEGNLRGKAAEPLSNATINRTVTELFKRIHKHARFAMKVEVAEINWKVVRLQEPEPRSRELTRDEEDALFKNLRTDMHAIVLFALATGLRKENAASIRRREIDLRQRQLTVKVKSDRPGRKTHCIPLTDAMVELLTTEMSLHQHDRVFSYQPHDTHGNPKPGAERRPMTITALRPQWKRALTRAKIEDFRWHDLRHTAGSRCARIAGLNVTKELLGHESIATTTRYAHVTRHDMLQAMEKMAASSVAESRNSPGASDEK
ncbi:tyrosine-type recombinase/integrase [Maricaulis sp.]|uniref:tyrosine-type recombinase/integrase n=1 Tax=Maricaulis sp. TaxID=1486257 RepID=UPI003A913CFF